MAEAPLPSVRLVPACDVAGRPAPAAWDALALDTADPNPFYERWFLAPSLEHIGRDDGISLLVFEYAGQLIGLLPVVGRKAYYGYPIPHVAGWLHDNAFCGVPLVRRGFEVAFWRALFAWADRNAGSALFLHLSQVPADSASLASLRQVIALSGRPAAIVQREDRAQLHSNLDSESYFAESMSSKKRKELRRQHNRLAELGTLAFQRVEGTEDLSGWVEQYLALEARGWKGRDGSALAQHPANARLFREALAGAANVGRLERLALMLDGRPIAMLVNFLTPPGAYSFKTAYDEAFARYSPGVLLQRENLGLLDRADVVWTDSCAAADHPMIERIWREKRTMVRLSLAIGGALRRLAARAIFRAERGSSLEHL